MVIDSHALLVGSPDDLLARMDEAHIDRAVLTGSQEGVLLSHTGESPATNRAVLAAVEAHPDRFIGCAYIHPLEKDAERQVEFWASAGFKALKFFPADGYSPDDRALWPVLEKMEERRMAALFHMGLADFTFDSVRGSRRAPHSAFAYPMRLDPTCRLFPGIHFLILNMGYPLMIEAWSVHHNNANIFLQIGGEGTRFTALATSYTALGGSGFIPLDYSRIVIGTGDAENLGKSMMLAEDSVMRMGCPRGRLCGVSHANAETLFRL